MQRLVGSAHAQATELLSDHRAELERLSQALLEAETLTAADACAAAGVPMRPSGTDAAELSLPFRSVACTGRSGVETVIRLRAAASGASLEL